MQVVRNGTVVSNYTPEQNLTQDEFDILPEEEKDNGTTYYVENNEEIYDVHKRINDIISLLGSTSILKTLGNGTIIGTIVALYKQLGDFNFETDISSKEVSGIQTTPYLSEIGGVSANSTDKEKLDYLVNVIGNYDDLVNIGYASISSALEAVFHKLGILS